MISPKSGLPSFAATIHGNGFWQNKQNDTCRLICTLAKSPKFTPIDLGNLAIRDYRMTKKRVRVDLRNRFTLTIIDFGKQE